jgi:hypothetical protein
MPKFELLNLPDTKFPERLEPSPTGLISYQVLVDRFIFSKCKTADLARIISAKSLPLPHVDGMGSA